MMETWRWLLGLAAEPLRGPATAWQWLAFGPLMLLAAAAGVLSAIVSAAFWLPLLALALAPVALVAAWWLARGG